MQRNFSDFCVGLFFLIILKILKFLKYFSILSLKIIRFTRQFSFHKHLRMFILFIYIVLYHMSVKTRGGGIKVLAGMSAYNVVKFLEGSPM